MKIDKLDSTESWKRFLLENGNYVLLSDFNNSKEKFEIKHNCENGKPYDVFPYVFKRGGGRCTFCNTKGFKKTTESVTIEFSKKNFKLLVSYKDTHTNMDFLCLTCNKIQNNSRTNVIKDSYNCPGCANKRKRKYYTEEQFIEFLTVERHGEFSLIGEFRPFPDKIKIRHNSCGYEWDVPYRSIIDMRGCPICVKKANEIKSRRTIDELKEIVESDNHYELITKEWVETHSKITILHKDCDRTFTTTPNSFINYHTRCYYCSLESNLSHNARRLYDKLNSLKIKFVTEFKIDGCKYKYKLPFDFAIEKDGFTTLIEYDGKQHFKPTFFSKGNHESFDRALENFKLTQLRDSIKNDFVRQNSDKYELIRLNKTNINEFLEFDIYELLKRFL